MPLLIIDGPEAAGKTTLIEAAVRLWPSGSPRIRKWGPVDGIHVYLDPLEEDIYETTDVHPYNLVVWDRSWASEVVYNAALNRGREIPYESIEALETTAKEGGVYRLMLVPSVALLTARRHGRAVRGEKPDLPIDPGEEASYFTAFASNWFWFLQESCTPRDLVSNLIPYATSAMKAKRDS